MLKDSLSLGGGGQASLLTLKFDVPCGSVYILSIQSEKDLSINDVPLQGADCMGKVRAPCQIEPLPLRTISLCAASIQTCQFLPYQQRDHPEKAIPLDQLKVETDPSTFPCSGTRCQKDIPGLPSSGQVCSCTLNRSRRCVQALWSSVPVLGMRPEFTLVQDLLFFLNAI